MSAAVLDEMMLGEPSRGSAPRRHGFALQGSGVIGRATTVVIRPARGSGRQAAPRLRPVGAVPAPDLRRDERSRAPRAAYVPLPAGSTWRLTDRGLALVTTAAAMIVAAALAVIILTAARVTSDTYVPGSGMSMSAAPAGFDPRT